MAAYLGLATEALETWLQSLGCTKQSCPSRFVCVWFAPNGIEPFVAPNPDYLPFVPVNQMSRLADIISDIMKNGGLGVP